MRERKRERGSECKIDECTGARTHGLTCCTGGGIK